MFWWRGGLNGHLWGLASGFIVHVNTFTNLDNYELSLKHNQLEVDNNNNNKLLSITRDREKWKSIAAGATEQGT